MSLKNESIYLNKLRKWLGNFKTTPFHPQWFLFRNNERVLFNIACHANGEVLDIGCGEKAIKKYLPNHCNYIGLDYYKTACEWYGSHPDLYGDGQCLPFKDDSIDTLLVLDVLEHLPNPEACFFEAKRVLVKDGVMVITVPFLYPIHDAPLDFNRWTIYGLRSISNKYNFNIVEEEPNGQLFETVGLFLNIALCKTIMNWIVKKNPVSILIIFLPFLIFAINIISFVLTCLSPKENIMAFGYRLVLKNQV